MNSKIVVDEVPPYLRIYEDGTIERLIGTEFAAPTALDPLTAVSSKDVHIDPQTALSARFYRPASASAAANPKPLPLVVYFHGGAFCISSSADPKYHAMLNLLVADANVTLLSVDYRKAPEHPLPAAYDDSFAALKWLSPAADDWLSPRHVDFSQVFLAGDSAGANIAHHLAIRAGLPGKELGELKIRGVLMIQPYFWGEEPMGVEAENPIFKAVVDKWWRFVCPSDLGCDDPWINPFVTGAPALDGLGCERVLICVAGNDILRERGKFYYNELKKSKWEGKIEVFETEGEDHVFHIMDPTSLNSKHLFNRCAQFINSHS